MSSAPPAPATDRNHFPHVWGRSARSAGRGDIQGNHPGPPTSSRRRAWQPAAKRGAQQSQAGDHPHDPRKPRDDEHDRTRADADTAGENDTGIDQPGSGSSRDWRQGRQREPWRGRIRQCQTDADREQPDQQYRPSAISGVPPPITWRTPKRRTTPGATKANTGSPPFSGSSEMPAPTGVNPSSVGLCASMSLLSHLARVAQIMGEALPRSVACRAVDADPCHGTGGAPSASAL